MEAYKFETTVLENGIIQIPEISQYANSSIEVFIIIKQPEKQTDTRKERTIEQFLEKWTGFLKGINPDDSKLQYLREKYE
jgi:hypothetical protein